MPYQFTFKEDDNKQPLFQCPLKQYQCKHTNPKTGKRCRIKQYIGFDLCWRHLQTDRHLKIKPSNIPHAGKGLFAYNGTDNNEVVFNGNQSRGDRIIAYNAEVISNEETIRRYGDYTAPYGAYIGKNQTEDASCLRSAGSLANHQTRSRANGKFYVYHGRFYLRATKNIRNGDEITVDYGEDYMLNEEGIQYETKYVRKK